MRLADADGMRNARSEILKMALRTDDAAAMYSKVTSVNSLPTYAECYELIGMMKRNVGHKATSWLLINDGIYLMVNDRLVNKVAHIISGLAPKTAVEICAGSGKLSYWVSSAGAIMAPTDSGACAAGGISERLDHMEALEKYRPDVVLASFPPSESPRILLDVLSFESVRHFVVLAKASIFVQRYAKQIGEMASWSPIEIPIFPTSRDGTHRERDEGLPLNAIFTRWQRV